MPFDADLFLILSFSALMVIGYPIAKAIGRRITSNAERRPLDLTADLTARLDRLEHMAEATQIEVERISEGQRFTTKLLSEQKHTTP